MIFNLRHAAIDGDRRPLAKTATSSGVADGAPMVFLQSLALLPGVAAQINVTRTAYIWLHIVMRPSLTLWRFQAQPSVFESGRLPENEIFTPELGAEA